MSTSEAEKYRIVTFKVAPADYAELEMLAKVAERTISAELRLAIRAWLAEQRKS
jgi:hypothetical protein